MGNAAYAVVISRPGHDTIRFGPLLQTMADEWQLCLESALVSTAHPAGTSITVEPFVPGTDSSCISPESIPASADELAERLRAGIGDDDPAARFPDLYTQLAMRHGDARAGQLWNLACHLLDEEAAIAQAQRDRHQDIARVQAKITECLASLEPALRSFQSARATADRFDIGTPADIAGCPADTAEHLAIALRELRAAALTLRPYIHVQDSIKACRHPDRWPGLGGT